MAAASQCSSSASRASRRSATSTPSGLVSRNGERREYVKMLHCRRIRSLIDAFTRRDVSLRRKLVGAFCLSKQSKSTEVPRQSIRPVHYQNTTNSLNGPSRVSTNETKHLLSPRLVCTIMNKDVHNDASGSSQNSARLTLAGIRLVRYSPLVPPTIRQEEEEEGKRISRVGDEISTLLLCSISPPLNAYFSLPFDNHKEALLLL